MSTIKRQEWTKCQECRQKHPANADGICRKCWVKAGRDERDWSFVRRVPGGFVCRKVRLGIFHECDCRLFHLPPGRWDRNPEFGEDAVEGWSFVPWAFSPAQIEVLYRGRAVDPRHPTRDERVRRLHSTAVAIASEIHQIDPKDIEADPVAKPPAHRPKDLAEDHYDVRPLRADDRELVDAVEAEDARAAKSESRRAKKAQQAENALRESTPGVSGSTDCREELSWLLVTPAQFQATLNRPPSAYCTQRQFEARARRICLAVRKLAETLHAENRGTTDEDRERLSKLSQLYADEEIAVEAIARAEAAAREYGLNFPRPTVRNRDIDPKRWEKIDPGKQQEPTVVRVEAEFRTEADYIGRPFEIRIPLDLPLSQANRLATLLRRYAATPKPQELALGEEPNPYWREWCRMTILERIYDETRKWIRCGERVSGASVTLRLSVVSMTPYEANSLADRVLRLGFGLGLSEARRESFLSHLVDDGDLTESEVHELYQSTGVPTYVDKFLASKDHGAAASVKDAIAEKVHKAAEKLVVEQIREAQNPDRNFQYRMAKVLGASEPESILLQHVQAHKGLSAEVNHRRLDVFKSKEVRVTFSASDSSDRDSDRSDEERLHSIRGARAADRPTLTEEIAAIFQSLSESDWSLAGDLVEGKSFVEIGEREERSEDSVRRQRNAIRKKALARAEGLSEASELRDRIQRAMSKSESPEPSRSASSLFDHVTLPAFWHELRADRRPLLIGEGA